MKKEFSVILIIGLVAGVVLIPGNSLIRQFSSQNSQVLAFTELPLPNCTDRTVCPAAVNDLSVQ